MNKQYYTEFYKTDLHNPFTGELSGATYHGIIYTNRKFWIFKRFKKKIHFHTLGICPDCLPNEEIRRIEKLVQSRVEEVLRLLESNEK